MPGNLTQKMFFAFVTVVVTVHAYVFYSLYVIHGSVFMESTGAAGVLDAIERMGGVPVLGRGISIWAVVLIEFVFAYSLEMLLGSPCSFKIACHYFDPRKNHPMIFETMIISATVLVMCPIMSFIAAILYYPYQYMEFNVFHFLAEWLKLICFNFPFAFFSQLFFIQPFVRTVFKTVFSKDIKARNDAAKEKEARVEEIEAELKTKKGRSLP